MKYPLMTLALLASGAVQASAEGRGVHVSCDMGTDYSVSMQRKAFLFTDDKANRQLGIGGGRLFMDGREVVLSAGDHQRLRQLEGEMQALVPEIERVTVAAVDIAFTALTEVARGVSSTPQATIGSLESAHRRVRQEMAAKPLALFNEDAMAGVVKPLVTEYVPQLVGGAVSTALKAAFAGEQEQQAFKARMERMGRELDQNVDARAKALEPLANAMCTRLRRMDGIDNSLEYRLPGGQPLDLLRVDPAHKD